MPLSTTYPNGGERLHSHVGNEINNNSVSRFAIIINDGNCSKYISLSICVKKIIFLRAHFCVIKQNLENIVDFLCKSPKRVTYSLKNNISHDHICYSMFNVNMLIIVTTCIIVHDVLVFYGLRSQRKLINLFEIAKKTLGGEVYNVSLK